MSVYSTQELAQMLKAAGDPLRLGILQLLGDGAFGVLELCRVFDIKQSSMSHHLKVLSQAGLVSTQREGNSIFYRRPLLSGQANLHQWIGDLFNTVDGAEFEPSIEDAKNAVLAERAEICAEFFARHADDFHQQQDLIATYEQYGQALLDIIDAIAWDAAPSALEIGPGKGEFIPELAKRFERVLAIDVSPDMLAKTQETITEYQLANVACRLSDTQELRTNKIENEEDGYQLAVANMVLHHVPSPKTIFADTAHLLAPGGTLLITDLCRHDQAWVRESCGDLWLGFEPEDLTAWAEESGLTEGQSQFLGLRNGFHIQFRLFHRPTQANV